jgi:hypothetical protein
MNIIAMLIAIYIIVMIHFDNFSLFYTLLPPEKPRGLAEAVRAGKGGLAER